MFLYGTNLLFDPVMEKPEEDEANPGRPKARLFEVTSRISDALNKAIASNPIKFYLGLPQYPYLIIISELIYNILSCTHANYIHINVVNCTSQVSMPYHVRVLVPCYKGDSPSDD